MEPCIPTAAYLRLSREDGDRAESDSIAHQRTLLTQYIQAHPPLALFDFYIDDGCTGTHFDRPAFRRMLADAAHGAVRCILVKDLSRFGRDYIGAGYYLERYFPSRGIRFISIGDGFDSADGVYDLMLPFRNILNAQYARDLSGKIRTAFRTMQSSGQFTGAFAAYGYRKSMTGHRLEIDPAAAAVVRRIFTLYEAGCGKVRIANVLNREGLPCPSEYKRLCGERYRNPNRLAATCYWTYSTIHKILQNEMYAGNMTQGHAVRQGLHAKARQVPSSEWIVVADTHEAIVPPAQWARVQRLLQSSTGARPTGSSLLSGLVKCADCGRSLNRTQTAAGAVFLCATHKRYGGAHCTPHRFPAEVLEETVRRDLRALLKNSRITPHPRGTAGAVVAAQAQLSAQLEGRKALRRGLYEDLRGGLLDRAEYEAYRAEYDRQIEALSCQLSALTAKAETPESQWLCAFAAGETPEIDRVAVVEAVEQIRVSEGGQAEIFYRCASSPETFAMSKLFVPAAV